MQQSNFSGARSHLERAFGALHGKDEFSLRAREALDLLIDGCVSMEFPISATAGNVALPQQDRT
jgi:hypothetical protein